MKWALASVGLLVVIVVFSLAALDQKNVVWDGWTPRCPHCRSEVNLYASVCPACGRAFDWETRESSCDVCLSELDARYYAKLVEDHAEKLDGILAASGWPEETVRDFRLYVRGLHSGTCLFCGGTGRWLALEPVEAVGENGGRSARTEQLAAFLEGRCPVCFGSGRDVFCDGDHRVVHGRESAARDLEELETRLLDLDLDREDAAELAFRAIQGFVRRHAGRREVALAPSFDGIAGQARADARWAAVKRILDRLAAGD